MFVDGVEGGDERGEAGGERVEREGRSERERTNRLLSVGHYW